jgi:hypothetical protein
VVVAITGVDVVVICGTVVVLSDVVIGSVVVVCCVVIVISDVVVVGDCDIDTVVAVVVMVVVSGFLGARMTNFNTSESVTVKIVRMIKEMKMFLTQRWRHHLRSLLFPVSYLMYVEFLCILCSTRNSN